MTLARVVDAAGGLTVARRGGAADAEARSAGLRVGPVGPVPLPASPALDAQRGDGVVWRRHWTQDGRMVLEFVDVACVTLEADGDITFDRDLDPEVEEHLLFDHVLPLALARAGHLVLHGGIVSRDGRGVALVGSSGAGKSTLAGYLWRHGWTLGNDDGVVVTLSPGPRAEPTYATLRLTADGAALVGIDPADATPIAGKLRLDGQTGSAFRQRPVDLVAVVIVEPEERASDATFHPLTGVEAHAELFGSTFHADFAVDQRLPQVLADLAGIVEACTVGRLLVPRGPSGLASAEGTIGALLDRSGPERP